MQKKYILPVSLFCLSSIIGCSQKYSEQSATEINTNINQMFTKTSGILEASDRERRKWDGPIIGDLDGDGLQDLILTEHGHRVNIFWNLGNRFSKPQVLIHGDMHGTGIADFDGDGRLEIIIAQGGGNGSNPRKPLLYKVNPDRTISKPKELSHFQKGRGRSIKTLDSDQDGAVDLFLTGFPMPEQFENGANQFYSNDSNGDFTFVSLLPKSERLSYRTAITDINNDNDPDIIVYGGGKMVLAQGSTGKTFINNTQKVFGDLHKINHVTAIKPFDFDGDGDFDLAISRAKHQFTSQRFYDATTQNFAFFSRFQPYKVGDLVIDGDLELHNLQVSYPDYSLFLGSNKTLIDGSLYSKPYSENDSNDLPNTLKITKTQAKGWPDDVCQSNKKIKDLPPETKFGLFIGYIGNNTWRLCSQTRSATAGVIKNVLAAPPTSIISPQPAKILRNDNGVFVDVTDALGVDIQEPTSSVVSADFNNDGWEDLLYMPYGNMSRIHKPIIYLNLDGQSFKRFDEHGIVMNDLGATGSGAEAFDFDKDGDYDLITSNERGKWRLFENHITTKSTHNYVGISLTESHSNRAILNGMTLAIDACGQTYIRNVNQSSSAYASSFYTDLLFGLGQCHKIDKVTATATSGEVFVLKNVAINEYNNFKITN